mgnify:FL=1
MGKVIVSGVLFDLDNALLNQDDFQGQIDGLNQDHRVLDAYLNQTIGDVGDWLDGAYAPYDDLNQEAEYFALLGVADAETP